MLQCARMRLARNFLPPVQKPLRGEFSCQTRTRRSFSSSASPAQQAPRTTLLIDGSNIAVRSFFAVKGLSSSSQTPTNVIQGYMNTCFALQKKFGASNDDVVHFFDIQRESDHRNDIYPGYKEGRTSLAEEYYQQLPTLKDALSALNQPIMESSEYEADDLIASYVRAHATRTPASCSGGGDDGANAHVSLDTGSASREESVRRLLIVSSDKDLMQEINAECNVFQVFPHKKPIEDNVWGDEDVFENLSVYPSQVVEYLSLVGDAADSIPGIAGVGAKTASKWLTQYKDIEGILKAAEEGKLKPVRFNDLMSTEGSRAILTRNVALITLIHSLEVEDATRAASQLASVTQDFAENAILNQAWRYNERGASATKIFADLAMWQVMRTVQAAEQQET